MIDTPQIKETDAITVATVALRIPKEEMQEHFPPAVDEIMEAIEAQEVEIVGPVVAHHLAVHPEIFDFEICVPVASPVEPTGRVQPSTLPATKVVQTTYHGPYDGLPEAWAKFEEWIDEQDLSLQPDAYERYVDGPHNQPDPEEWRTELARPID